jgi:hypothetical protein
MALASAPRATAAEATRRIRLDTGWRFAFGPREGAERGSYSDADWEPVTVPHTWNAQDAFTRVPSFREGQGWYRRHVTLDRALEGRRLTLRFEAANQVADVWWNGVRLGRHAGGYTAFAFDVTEASHIGGDNLLAVRVDNTIGPVPPLIADYDFYGGLYRDVWLIDSDPVHFSWLDHGAPGAWAAASDVSAASATVQVRARIANRTPRRAAVEVVARVRDPEGRSVLSPRARIAIAAGVDTALEMPAGVIRAPRCGRRMRPTSITSTSSCASTAGSSIRRAPRSGCAGSTWIRSEGSPSTGSLSRFTAPIVTRISRASATPCPNRSSAPTSGASRPTDSISCGSPTTRRARQCWRSATGSAWWCGRRSRWSIASIPRRSSRRTRAPCWSR